ncbi:DUF4192 domain-containing protein [Mycolicibacterium sp.]|uniref:DUF4192 domain-containing protein n=1 Tax=Mycolicibacterium sp. TaxID=2320850 RepID=UPI003D1174B9
MSSTHRFASPLDRPGALIAALPAVLGFVPEKSLVLVTIYHGAMGAVLRTDLDAAESMGELADLAVNAGAEEAVAVIVDADGFSCRMCAEDHRDLVADLAGELDRRDIELLSALIVDNVARSGRFHCADGCGLSGAVDDPSASPIAAAAVLDGRRLYTRRAELVAVICPLDPERAATLAALLDRTCALDEARPDQQARDDVEHALECAAQLGTGRELADDQLARLALALTDVRVRDTLFALAVGDNAGSAESLWADLSRRLPEPWQVEPLVLLAFSAYARGDGPLAGIALDAALTCQPDHRMAGMLDRALRAGMRPEQIRELARTGYRLAKQLGVRLPPRRAFGRRAG